MAASARRDMPKRRKETSRSVPDPEVPPRPPKGKRGDAAKTQIRRAKEPLQAVRKVKG